MVISPNGSKKNRYIEKQNNRYHYWEIIHRNG
jgi:hypothetical protein